jgi:hypothetical protein
MSYAVVNDNGTIHARAIITEKTELYEFVNELQKKFADKEKLIEPTMEVTKRDQ